ncbi:MAG: GntR family transcriptional regulator [Victivallales bacterium]
MIATTKQEGFRDLIARRILSGELLPGGRLKSYDSIIDELKLSKTTLQISIEKMKSDGLLTSRNRVGLFVDARPPCLYNVGMVIPREYESSLFIQAMGNAIEKTLNQAGYRVFRSLERQPSLEFRLDSCEIYGTAVKRLVKGCIFVGDLEYLSPGDRFFKIPSFPIVHFGPPSESLYSLRLNSQSLADKCAERVSMKKRNAKVAFLFLRIPPFVEKYVAAAKARGLICEEKWIHYIGRDALPETGNVIRLLLDAPASRRPDAIVIADDNLVPYFVETIRELGAGALKGINVLAHCNYPVPEQDTGVPLTRIGFNSQDAADVCLEILGPAGLPLPSDCLQREFEIKAYFEEEITYKNSERNKTV